MAKVKEKQQAIELRLRGKSIKDIAKKLDVSKGSVSLWCQDIELSDKQKQRLKEKQILSGAAGRYKGAESNRQKRLDNITKQATWAKQELGILTKRDLFLLGVGLYWGEGVKSRSGMATIVNSDPALILLSKQWFEACFGVASDDFRPYVYVSAHHKKRQKQIVNFWADLLGLPLDFFTIILLKHRPKKIYPNHNTYHGVLHLRVRRSTDLKYKIAGLIEACTVSG